MINSRNISQYTKAGVFLILLLAVYNCTSTQNTVADQMPDTSDSLVDTTAVDSAQLAQEEAEELRKALIELYKGEIYSKYQSQANTLTNYYILAQQHFYAGDYENALYSINRAALIKENADILALRGNIYLALGYMNEFVTHWRRALDLDATVPIPQSAYIIQQLQYNGLIDENLKKSF